MEHVQISTATSRASQEDHAQNQTAGSAGPTRGEPHSHLSIPRFSPAISDFRWPTCRFRRGLARSEQLQIADEPLDEVSIAEAHVKIHLSRVPHTSYTL